MAGIVFQDTFTEGGGDVTLASHTPDTGTSWTLLFQDASGPTFTVLAATDRCQAATVNDKGAIYTADATYPSADYDVVFTLLGLSSTTSRKLYILVRVQDQENMYAVQLANATGICRLYKKVGGTWTALGSLFDCPAINSVCKLEIIGTALKFYDDGVEVASATVSDISAAGKAGLATGGGAELVTSTDDSNSATLIDALTVTDLGVAAGSVIPILMRQYRQRKN